MASQGRRVLSFPTRIDYAEKKQLPGWHRGATARRNTRGGGRRLGFEPLESRALLATGLGAETSTELGAVAYRQIDVASLPAEGLWFHMTAVRSGMLSAESSDMSAELTLYSSDLTELAASPDGLPRVDYEASSGTAYYLYLTGTGSDESLSIANLVTRLGSQITVSGTAANDTFDLDASAGLVFSINLMEYAFEEGEIAQLTYLGGGHGAEGDDAMLVGTASDDTVRLRPYEADAAFGALAVAVRQVEAITVAGGTGGLDVAHLFDSAGDDIFEARPARTTLYVMDTASEADSPFSNEVQGFTYVHGYSNAGGADKAYLNDSDGDDSLTARREYARLVGPGYWARAKGFAEVNAMSEAGNDTARLYGSRASDRLSLTPDSAEFYGDLAEGRDYYYRVDGFPVLTAYAASGGYDTVSFADGPGNDLYRGDSTRARMSDIAGVDYSVEARGFRVSSVHSTAGSDEAELSGSAGEDLFRAWPQYAEMRFDITPARAGGVSHHTLSGFSSVEATAAGGLDTAHLFQAAGDNAFIGRVVADPLTVGALSTEAELSVAGKLTRVLGFERVHGYAADSDATASLYGAEASSDDFYADMHYSRLIDDAFYIRARGFGKVHAYGRGGSDSALLKAAEVEDGELAWQATMQALVWLHDFEQAAIKQTPAGTILPVDAVTAVMTAYWEADPV